MKPVLFRCPERGTNVQWRYTPAKPADDGSPQERFEAIDCPACGRMHLFNPSTGKLHAHRAPRGPQAGRQPT